MRKCAKNRVAPTSTTRRMRRERELGVADQRVPYLQTALPDETSSDGLWHGRDHPDCPALPLAWWFETVQVVTGQT